MISGISCGGEAEGAAQGEASVGAPTPAPYVVCCMMYSVRTNPLNSILCSLSSFYAQTFRAACPSDHSEPRGQTLLCRTVTSYSALNSLPNRVCCDHSARAAHCATVATAQLPWQRYLAAVLAAVLAVVRSLFTYRHSAQQWTLSVETKHSTAGRGRWSDRDAVEALRARVGRSPAQMPRVHPPGRRQGPLSAARIG